MAAYSLSFWKTILPHLAHWREFDIDQRAAALELTPGFQTLPRELAALPADLRERFFDKDAKGRHRPIPEFRRLVDFVDRLGKWSRLTGIDTTIYVQQLTTYTQRHALTGIKDGATSDIAAAALERRMAEGWFVRQWLEKDSRDAFLAAVSNWTPEEVYLTAAHYQALRSWLKQTHKRDIPAYYLKQNTFEVPGAGIPPEELLYIALAYGLVQIVLYPESFEVAVQLLNPSEKAIQHPDRAEMRKLAATQSFSRPYLIDDVEGYLRAVKAEPAPLLSDGIQVPVAHHRKVAKRFLTLPEPLPREGFAPEDRAKAAWWFINALGLVSMTGRGRKTWKAELHANGEAWLLLDRWRKLESLLENAPFGARKAWKRGERHAWLGDFETLPLPYSAITPRLFEWLDALAAGLNGSTQPIAFWDWLASAVAHANPLLADLEADPYLPGQWARWDRQPQSVFAEFLCHYLGRLSSLGAIALCQDAQGNLGVSLTAIGRHCFGQAETWEISEETRRIAVVGADFSIVLLQPDPELVLELAPFAEPAGNVDEGRPVLHLRLTRCSVQAAAHNGYSAESMLKVLNDWSRHPVPGNVVHEVKAWAGSRAAVRVSETVLLDGEDPMAMAEILSAFPKDFVRLTPTVLRYMGTSKKAVLLKRLAKRGFFGG
ncbi:MAG: helicase-associated domain-containing protein [Fibrobacteria bacterium]